MMWSMSALTLLKLPFFETTRILLKFLRFINKNNPKSCFMGAVLGCYTQNAFVKFSLLQCPKQFSLD